MDAGSFINVGPVVGNMRCVLVHDFHLNPICPLHHLLLQFPSGPTILIFVPTSAFVSPEGDIFHETPCPEVTIPHPTNIEHDQLLPSPVDPEALSHLLQDYDPVKATFLINGFRHGFRVHFEGDLAVPSTACKNLKSAYEVPQVVDSKLEKEIQAGRIVGPFDTVPFANMKLSPLGVVPKKAPGQYRLIHHLSYPPGNSVNDGISDSYTSVRYTDIQDAISHLKMIGSSAYMAKTDIESAFRIIPIHPSCYYLMGFQWKGQFYYDRALEMGLSESCFIFEAFSSALEWALYHFCDGPYAIVHILDDFLFMAPSNASCQYLLSTFQQMCSFIGVPLSREKTFSPAPVMIFMGITLDAFNQEARLPLDKLQHCAALCQKFRTRKKVSLKELQSIVGTLQFATSVVIPGKAFLRRMIDLTVGIQKSYHLIRLTNSVRADLALWEQFLSQFNGRSFFRDEQFISNHSLHLYTDSASTLGFGGVLGNAWFYGSWEGYAISQHITALEMYPIVVAMHVWGSQIKNKNVQVHTDNLALSYIINNQTSRDPVIMSMVRPFVLMCLKWNILFKASHIDGCHNVLADSLSRLQVERFRRLAPSAHSLPTPVPPQVAPAVFFRHSDNS